MQYFSVSKFSFTPNDNVKAKKVLKALQKLVYLKLNLRAALTFLLWVLMAVLQLCVHYCHLLSQLSTVLHLQSLQLTQRKRENTNELHYRES